MPEIVEIIAELSTNHGGDVGLAEALLHAAAKAGATTVKTQAYSLERLNPRDPQADWLRQSYLPLEAHQRLMAAAKEAGVAYLVTPFDKDALAMLRGLGLTRFKVASSESGRDWWRPDLRTAPLTHEQWYVSYPWGVVTPHMNPIPTARLTAIPLYPTPLEAVGRAAFLGGWSDHGDGLSACYRALALGATVLEVHFKIDGKGRNCPWDKSADDLRRLRAFADDCLTMQTGVATKFRERWRA